MKAKLVKESLNETRKEILGSDFKDLLTNEWFNDAADSHIEAWKDRYRKYNSKKEVEYDLNVNHDISLEIEAAEELLGRKLTDDEYSYLENIFNRTVVKNINLRKLKYDY